MPWSPPQTPESGRWERNNRRMGPNGDLDRDGICNRRDRDIDGDRIANARDRFPYGRRWY